MEHTPRPWRQEMEPNGIRRILAKNGPVEVCIAEVYGGPADAELIAAAPELLEECKAWLSSYDGWSDVELAKRVDIATLERIKYTRAVVRKVEGE